MWRLEGDREAGFSGERSSSFFKDLRACNNSTEVPDTCHPSAPFGVFSGTCHDMRASTEVPDTSRPKVASVGTGPGL
jgi:hypothetical protein